LTFRSQPKWLLLATVLLWWVPSARTQAEKHATFYAPAASYSVPVTAFEGKDYLGLADVLEPLGNLEAKVDGKKWKLRFTPNGGHEVEAEFSDGKNKGKVRGQDFQLASDFHMANGRGYVPVRNLGVLLPIFTGMQTSFRENSLRFFLGNSVVSFTQEIQKSPTPKLILNFTSPVNPAVSTEPGKLRLTFRREGIVNAGSNTVDTSDSTITGTVFNDSTGSAQITVNGTAPLTAAFSNGNKTVTITPAAPAPAEAAKSETPQATQPVTPATNPSAPNPGAPATPAGPRFLVIIDPAHGGDERGAAITESIKEKDVNLAIARRLQHELQNKGINAALLRYADTTVSLDDRAIATNYARPAVYVCLHAANLGTGARIFTALMAPTALTTRSFLPWPQAQAPFLDLSSQVAGSISAELSNRQIAVTALPAPLRPMRNIAAPAIAIEIAPPNRNVENINSSDYQENIAAAVANGIAAMKPKLLGAR
jgi:N-acetylmuramoyl-L-alanine amidase